MGGHVVAEDPASNYFLHGWKGDEDEDVEVDSSEGSGEEEVEGLRRQTVAISSAVHEPVSSKKGRNSAETSAQETSDVGDSSIAKSQAQRGRASKELEQVLNNTSTAAKRVDVKKAVEEPGAVLLPGESSSTRSTSRLQPKKLNEGKRLNARRFRDHFAAKLKKPNITEGNGQKEAGSTPKDKIILISSSPRAESKAVRSSSSEQEEGTVTLHVNLEVEQDKDSDFALNGDSCFGNTQSCKVFTRKRKQLPEGVANNGENEMHGTDIGQKKNGIQIEKSVLEKSSDQKNSESTSDKLQELDTTLDSSSKDVSNSGRSKRARKHNRQTDYIPWSDFGRLSARKSDSSKHESFVESASGTETDSKRNGSKNSSEKEPKDTSISPSTETRVAAQAFVTEGVEPIKQMDCDHETNSPSAINRNDSEKEQTIPVQENRIALSHSAILEELEVVHQRSPKPSDVQENTNQKIRGVDEAVLQDEGVKERGSGSGAPDLSEAGLMLGTDVSQHKTGTHHDLQDKSVKECGSGSRPPDLSEAGLMLGTDTSQHKAGTDRDLDPRAEEEGMMHKGQPTSSEITLRKEHCRLSMKGGAEKDTVSKIQQEGVEVIEAPKGVALDNHDSVCNKCNQEGKLICCDGKNCKVTFHIDCLDPPLMDVPPNDWYCPDCAYKRIVSGMHSVSKGIESIWDVKEGNLDATSLSSKGCYAQKKVELQRETLHKDEFLGEGLGDKKQGEAELDSSMLKTAKDQSKPAIGSANDTTCFLQKSLSSASCAEKMYFVKFKGVAHVHNLWLSESQVVKEAPKLLHSFKKLVEEGKAPQWDPEWVKPFRIIGKRKTMLPSRSDLSVTDDGLQSGHCVEWCIKWRKLGYESCTWEPADTMPVKSAYLKKLMENFQLRSDKAKRRSESEKTCKVGSISSLRIQPSFMLDEHQSQIEVMQKLLCNWQKHIHSVVVNEVHQDRMRITAAFLMCLLEQCVVTKPCLVVVPTTLLAEWKAALFKWLPAGTVVVYAGTKVARRIIERYEFYNEEGICMVQIALTSFDTLNLDVEVLKGLNLEAFIIDECQRLRGSRTNKSLRQFSSSYRLLLFSEPLKNMTDDYHSLLALLSSSNDLAREKDCTADDDNATLVQLKADVSKHIVQECKQELSGPKEFWVPIKMTALQVEQYCKLLIDKCDMLARNKRGDIASSLHDLLLKIRECCNHPYLVKPSLQESLINPTARELLEFGIGASGKLKLLDMMLSEAKSLKKRVVIITQIHLRVEKVSQMDILDDYMRQQFGVDSYERLDGGLEKSKKAAAVQRFNASDSKSFVFLLDRRACGPSIKLQTVNCIVIFDSDWNPQTDIQALLRMHSNRDLEHMAICRFYCPHTVEERVLISARKHSDLDSNHHNFALALCQKLLRWGAHKNFELFDSFSRYKDKVKLADELNYSTELVNRLLRKDFVESTPELCAIDSLWKTALYPRLAGQYDKGPPLFGETNDELVEEETVSATEFWTEMLRDRHVEAPDGQVRELRARKKVQYHEDSFNTTTNTQELEEEESRRKRRRVAESPDFTNVGKSGKSTLADRIENSERAHISKPGAAETAIQRPKPGAAETAQLPSGLDKVHVNKTTNENRVAHGGLESSGAEVTSEPITGAKSEQQQLLLSMKSDLDKLCQALQFQADTAGHVEQLLFSVGNFFKLPKDRSLLHAIELSLCWLAAEQQHYSIDRHATLALAETCFGVQLDKIDTVYAKLEERWKKRIEQGAQQAPSSRGQDNDISHRGDGSRGQDNDISSHRGDQDPTSRTPDHELNPLRDTHGLLQAPSNPPSDDPRIVGSIQNGQEALAPRDALVLKQGPVNSVIPEQQQVLIPCETNNIAFNNFEIQPSNEEAQAVPGFQVADELQEPFSDANRVASLQRQTSINERQRSERVQALIHAQKTQLRTLELLESSYKQKLKQHYESELLKLHSSRRASSGELVKLLGGLKNASSTLTTFFRAIRNNLIKKQHEERSRGNKFMTSQLERNSSFTGNSTGGEAMNSSAFENIDIDFSEKSIYDSLPQGLKAALETGDLGAVPPTSGSDRTNLPAAGSILNNASQGPQAPNGADHQSLPLAPDSGISPPVLLQNQPSLDLSEPQMRVAPNPQQQRHLQQRPLQDNLSQQGQQQRRPSDLVQAQTVVTSGHQEPHWQHAQSQQQRSPVPHPQPLLSPAPLPPSPSSPLPPTPQPQPQSQTQPFSRQPQLPPEVQQTQPLQGGVVIPPLHAHQQISGSALTYPNEIAQTLLTSATHQQPIAHPSSIRGSAAGTSVANRTPQNVQPRTNQQYQNDPLAQEFLRLRKEQEKIKSTHEVEKDRIKGQFMKELEVLSKKYESMLQEEDSVYTQKVTALEINLKKVEMNRRLAEVFRLKNSQDNSLINSAGLGQDSRTTVGASQVPTYQQHTPLMAVRTPLTTQGTVATPALPLMPAVAMASAPLFERPARAPPPGVTGAQLAATLAGASWHYSQGQTTIASIGISSQAANAGASAGPIAPGQSRLTTNASHLLHEGSRLLASRVTTQLSGPMNMSVQRLAPAVVSNTPMSSINAASFVEVQDSQILNLVHGGNYPQVASSQYNGGPLGRIPTTNVQTYATSVTPQCNTPTSQVLGDSGIASQAHAGVLQDSHVSLGIQVPIPEFSAIASERLASDGFGMEIPRLPPSNNEDFQADENRHIISTSQGLPSQDALNRTSFQLPTLQIHVVNGLASTHTGHFDEGRSMAPCDVICLSDDD